METGEQGDNNPFAPPTPPVASEPEVRGGGGAEVTSIGSDNPFAAALTSISLHQGDMNVPSVSSPEGSATVAAATTTTTTVAAFNTSGSRGGTSSSIASKLTGLVDGLGAWASGGDPDNDERKKPSNTSGYPFEDGILGEGLPEFGSGAAGGSRLFHPGDAVSQAEASTSARERELERREARIRVQEEILEANMARMKRKNWPSFRPILYHDINAEIPAVNRGMVRAAYITWILTAAGQGKCSYGGGAGFFLLRIHL